MKFGDALPKREGMPFIEYATPEEIEGWLNEMHTVLHEVKDFIVNRRIDAPLQLMEHIKKALR